LFAKPTEPTRDYSDFVEPWETKHLDRISNQTAARDFPITGVNYAMKESNRHLWMTDREQPYQRTDGQSFTWRRGAHVGGRSLLWGRASYRFSPYDFEVNKLDGEGVDWPVRYGDIAPWYDHVEKFAGIAGNRDGIEQLPDGKHFQPAFEHTCAELDLKEKLKSTFPERQLIMGRVAHLTEPTEEQLELGRGRCQARNRCNHGCSFGAYFSSNHATRNLMDHIGGSQVVAHVPGHLDKYFYGRRPIGAYIPRYRNYPKQEESYKRGWGYQVYSWREGWGANKGIGEDFKTGNRTPGPWGIMLDAFGECLPDPTNTVTAHKTKTDTWGMPIAVVDFKLGTNEEALMRAAHADAFEIFKAAGFNGFYEATKPDDNLNGVLGRIHEMGTARMGRDPKTSVLNGWNQSHDIPNLFITDGSFMTSSAVQNPSLTYMAFSARAAHYAADLLEEGEL